MITCGVWNVRKLPEKSPGLPALVIALKMRIITTTKKRLREIDKRLLYLRRCIDSFKVIEYHPNQEGKVMFGAWVEIENVDKGLKKRLRIVGYEELIGHQDHISMDSPMAQSLLHKKVGDEVIVKTKIGNFTWRINAIEYEKGSPVQ